MTPSVRRGLQFLMVLTIFFVGLAGGWFAAETLSPTLERTRALRAGITRLTEEDCRALAHEAGAAVRDHMKGAAGAAKDSVTDFAAGIKERVGGWPNWNRKGEQQRQ